MKQTFEYCSLQYLNQWILREKQYVSDFSSDDYNTRLTALKNAGAYFSVARTLHHDKLKGKDRYIPVLEILDNIDKKQLNDDPADTICDIESKISKKYKRRKVISLTTKFLWLKVMQPVLIYDSRAREVVSKTSDDYRIYYKNWKKLYTPHRTHIQNICSKLHNLHLYTADYKFSADEIKEITSKSWFHERVFDIYLWHAGSKS